MFSLPQKLPRPFTWAVISTAKLLAASVSEVPCYSDLINFKYFGRLLIGLLHKSLYFWSLALKILPRAAFFKYIWAYSCLDVTVHLRALTRASSVLVYCLRQTDLANLYGSIVRDNTNVILYFFTWERQSMGTGHWTSPSFCLSIYKMEIVIYLYIPIDRLARTSYSKIIIVNGVL